MSERERATGATWKAVRTLEYKKKQKAPHTEPKGFGAILDEAQDAVTDKRTASGNSVPSYLNRLSEIQIQDEAYIHQQLVKPDEVKSKRGLQSLVSKGKGRGIRLPRSSASRKVRFNEDGHSKAAAPGAVRADAVSGAAEHLAQVYKVSSPTAPKHSASFSTGSKSPGARRAGSVGFRDSGDSSDGTAATAAGEHGPVSPVELAATGKAIARRSGTSSGNNSSAGAASAVPDGHPAPGQWLSCGGQSPAKAQPAQLSVGPLPAGTITTTSGDGGIMARFLNQHYDDLPELTTHKAGSSSGHWEEPSTTQLADQQLQMLRTSTAPTTAAEASGKHDDPEGFRPLAISEDIFARWSSAAGGNNSSSKCASGGGSSPSKPSTSGDASPQHHRRVSCSGILKMPAADQQVLSGGGGSTSGHMRSMRATADDATGSHAGATDSLKPRRSADYSGYRSSCDGQGSRLSSGTSVASSGEATPERRTSSPRINNGTAAQHSSSPGALAGTGGLKGRSNRLLDLSGSTAGAHRSSSPSRSGAAGSSSVGTGAAGPSRSSRMSSADSGSGSSTTAGGPTKLVSSGASHSGHQAISSSSGGTSGVTGLRKSSEKGLQLPNIGRAAGS